MVRIKKKGESGTAASYISRNRALKKLQLSLSDFRRLCILKGIYPRDPKHKNKIGGKGTGTNKRTVYLLKDIQFLSHEPLLVKFRQLRAFHRRLRKYVGRKDWSKVKSLEEHLRPTLSLDHLVRERYPSFVDALRDLDDTLSMLALFASLPRLDQDEQKMETGRECARLLHEFEAYVISTGSLRRAFISIKGIYYQAEVMGQTVTWIVPHELSTPPPRDVDYRVMLTFLHFYRTVMRFVNFRLFARLGWPYPSPADLFPDERLVQSRLPQIDTPALIFPDGDKRLLSGVIVYISREVPCSSLALLLQSMGAQISWASDDETASAPLAEDDPTITHQIVDRPSLNRLYMGRSYVQPQWVFDSLNAGKLLDTEPYRIGAELPPHLSPFVQEEDEEKVSEAVEEPAEAVEEVETSEKTVKKRKQPRNKKSKVPQMDEDQKSLAVTMLSKKQQKLYRMMQHSRKKKDDEKATLEAKRMAIANKKNKKA